MNEQRAAPQVDIRHRIDAARLALNLSLTTQAEKHIYCSKQILHDGWQTYLNAG